MKWTVLVLVVLGIVAAVCATFLVNVLRHEMTRSSDKYANAEVVMAATVLPAMSVVTSEHIFKDKISKQKLPVDYLSDPVQAVGKVLAVPVVTGQVLTRHCFVTEGTGAQLAAVLPHGMRAASVPVSKHSVMGGLLYPGCVVDVLASFKLSSKERSKGQAISTTLLQNIQVLAVQDTSVVSKPDPDKQDTLNKGRITNVNTLTVTLMVDSKQAEALQLAKENGRITLAMRNPLDKRPVDIGATVLSQGRLAKWGSALAPSVFAAQITGVGIGRDGVADPNSAALAGQLNHGLKPTFPSAFSIAESWAERSGQWEVTVIRGRKVTEEVLEISGNNNMQNLVKQEDTVF